MAMVGSYSGRLYRCRFWQPVLL